jgi:RNA polymerase-binding protein
MAERALRGTRLGATSYENDRNTDLAPRQEVAFDCPNGHHFSVPFAAEAELPPTWECRVCGAMAIAASGESPSPKKVKPPRSHWDMLMERRTLEDLEAVLAERLEVIRQRRALEAQHQRRSALFPGGSDPPAFDAVTVALQVLVHARRHSDTAWIGRREFLAPGANAGGRTPRCGRAARRSSPTGRPGRTIP